MEYNMIVAGVGGQGSILASHIIAEAAINDIVQNGGQGNVRVGETFGAAQRGGAVASHVKIGDIYGPLVRKGHADLVLALEPLEGLRIGADYLAPGGIAILNTVPESPVDVKVGAVDYPALASICAALSSLDAKVVAFDAGRLALKAGSAKCVNVVMLGAACASGVLPFSEQILVEAVKNRLPDQVVELNLQAFALGKEAYVQALSSAW